ncbi:hypothetical protein ABNF97_27515 [Plantactinospora sp. B6F1]|uniref:hypothetical protein n=1 Tax=Plantactinospora sp. B6F1 TaxID=3158971 RepID=UPI0032D8C21F
MVTLQDAWLLAADGLHIHRWYLHAEPFRWDRVRDRYHRHEQRDEIDKATGGRPIEDSGRRLGVTILEHLLCQPVTSATVELLRDGWTGVPALAVGPHRALVADADRCLPAGESYVVPADVIRDPAGAPPSRFAAAVDALLAATGLGYLVRLAGGAIIHEDGVLPGERDVISDDEPLTTLVVSRNDDPAEYTADLVAAAGVEFLRLFIETGNMYVNATSGPPDARPAKRFHTMPDGTRVSSCLPATRAFAAAVRHRYWQRLASALAPGDSAPVPGGSAGAPDLPVVSRDQIERHLATASAELRAVEDIVYPVAESLSCIDSFDLINSYVPGPRQFEKNLIGLGPGQGH